MWALFFIIWGILTLFISIIFFIVNYVIGIIFLVVALILIILGVIVFIRNMKLKKEFESWLSSQNFSFNYINSKFIVDTNQKKWCLFNERHIYSGREITGIKLDKTTRTETTSKRSSSGYRWSSNYRTGKGTRTSVTQKISTYCVYLQTSNVGNPIVKIPCRDYDEALTVKTTAELLKKAK